MRKILNYILFAFVINIAIIGCEKDDEVLNPTYGKPLVTLLSGTNTGSFAIGRTIKIPLQLTAEGYLEKLVIERNGAVFATVPFTNGGSLAYDYETLVDNAWLGTTQIFTFKLFDKQGVQSDNFVYTATISALVPTYTIAPVTINGQVFNKITGLINFDETLTPAAKWLISGTVSVD